MKQSMCKHPYANFLSEVCCFVSFRFVCSGARRRVDTKKPLSTSEPIDILRYNGLDSICIGIREHRKCYALNRIFGCSVWLRLCRATFRSKLFRILRLFTIAHIYLSMYKYIFHRFMIFIAVLGPSVFWLTEFIIYELLLLCIFYFSCSGGGGRFPFLFVYMGIETGFVLSILSVYLAVRLKYTIQHATK